MANTITDQFDLVQIEEAKGIFFLFSRRREAADGFCLVVFRKDAYIGSILSEEIVVESDIRKRYDRLGVREGDTILRINLGPRILTITNKMYTQDGYTRAYELLLEIQVNDPRVFAQKYRQQSDPVNMAKIAIEGAIQRYAARKFHDDIREETLRDYAEGTLTDGTNKLAGIAVNRAHKAIPWMDPNRAKQIEIWQKTQVRETEIQAEKHIKELETRATIDIQKVDVGGKTEIQKIETDFEREQKRTAAQFDREEEMKQKEYELNLEAYTLQQKALLRSSTRVDELSEKDHELALDAKQQNYLRLQAGDQNKSTRIQEREQSQFMRDEQKLQREHDADKDLYLIEQKAKQREQTRIYEIEEQEHGVNLKTKQLAHERREALLRTVGEDAMQALSEYIREQIADGERLSNVFNDYPELKDIFLIPARSTDSNPTVKSNPLRLTNDASSASSDANSSNSTINTSNALPNQDAGYHEAISNTQDTGPLPGILRQQNDTIQVPDLGILLIQTTLSAEQLNVAALTTPTAFIICKVNENGLAKKARLMVGDILIEINGKVTLNIQTIIEALKLSKQTKKVTLCTMRGEALINMEVDSSW